MEALPDSAEELGSAGELTTAGQPAPAQDTVSLSGPVRKGRYSRAEGSASPTLTPQKLTLLRFLGECRLLSLPQLARLCCPSEQSARRHLRELYDGGLVEIIPVSRAALSSAGTANDAGLLHGSAPNVYVATKAGLEILIQRGYQEREVLRRPATVLGPKNALFLAHELAVRDVRVWLELDAQANPRRQVLRWHDGADAHMPLNPKYARPDAWFIYQIGWHHSRPDQDDLVPLVLVGLTEIDRGTERGSTRWSEKVDDYYALFHRGGLQAVTGYKNARVLVFVPDGRRRDLLAELILTLIRDKGYPQRFAERFWLAEHAFLVEGTIEAAVWRRPGNGPLHPLLSVETLMSAQQT